MHLSWQQTKIRKIALALALFGVALALVLGSIRHAREVLREVTAMTEERQQVHITRIHLQSWFDALLDMETGMRGFVLTGREDFLTPYLNGAEKLPSAAEKAMQALAIRPNMQGVVPKLLELQMRRVKEIELLIERRQREGAAVLSAPEDFEPGRQLMDELRSTVDGLDLNLASQALAINESVETTRVKANETALVAGAAAMVLILTGVGLLLMEYVRRLNAEGRLEQANLELNHRVAERTAELAEVNDRLAQFAAEQERAIEAERKRLSREVHDQIGQAFTALRLIMGSVAPEAYPPGQREALNQALDMGIESSRRITAELRPPLLDALGLASALLHFGDQLASRSALNVRVDVEDEESLTPEQALALFRIIQEATTNVVRHAGASQVSVQGWSDGATYRLEVVDNGCGLAGNTLRPGALGVVGMQERARLMGGVCSVASLSSGGVKVQIELPVEGT